nr:hypothetical protein CFP56_15762 [Quercus suber]
MLWRSCRLKKVLMIACPTFAIFPSIDVTQLDLQNCCHWNCFLKVFADTLTDLARTDFLAIRRSLYYLFQIFLNVSLLWMHGETNGQWLAHKKAVAERERQLSLKKERSSEKKDGLKGKEKDSSKDRQAADAENLVSEVKRSEKKTVPKTDSKTVATKKQGDGNSSKTEIKADKDDKDDERKTGEKSGMVPKVETDADKKKVPQNDGKKGKLKAGDKSKDEKSKESKLRLLSHSPDSFLDYTDKDIQESTFEKLRLKFVTKT